MRRPLRTAVLILVAVSLATLPLAGCTVAGSGSSQSADSGVPAIGTQQLKVHDSKAADESDNRTVIKTGSMTITVSHPANTATKASRIVEAVGGRIDSRTEQAAVDGNKGSASLTVRIPSAKLTSTIEKLKKLGTVDNLTISSEDVTAQSRDLNARISALRTSVARLQTLMAKATSTQDLITIESALSERQGNLESLESQQRQLKDQVDLSSITLYLNSVSTAQSGLPGNFLDGLIVGWQSIVTFFAGLLVVVGVLLPWLIIAGVLTFGVLALLRVRRKQRIMASPPQDEARELPTLEP